VRTSATDEIRAGSASAARTWTASPTATVVAAARGTVTVVEVTRLGTVTVIVTPPGVDLAATVEAAATPHAARTAAVNVSVIPRRMTRTVIRASDDARSKIHAGLEQVVVTDRPVAGVRKSHLHHGPIKRGSRRSTTARGEDRTTRQARPQGSAGKNFAKTVIAVSPGEDPLASPYAVQKHGFFMSRQSWRLF
jgi:hypothetical protein